MATTFDPTKNFGYGLVLTPPSPADSGDTLVLESGDGDNFPDPAVVGDYNITIFPAGQNPLNSNAEIARVTAKSGDTLTITRTEESTSARTIVAGDQVSMTITAKVIGDIHTAVNALEDYVDQDVTSGSSPTLDGTNFSGIDHTTALSNVGTNTHEVLDAYMEWWNNINMAGRLYGGAITDDGDGTITVAAGGGLIKADSASPEDTPTSTNQGQGSNLSIVTWAQGGLTPTDNAYNYIYYDGSAGALAITTNFYDVDFTRDFTLGRVYRSGTTVTIRLCGTNLWNFNRRVQLFGEEVFPVIKATGMVVGETGERYLTVTAGVLWAELVNRFSIDALDTSGADTFTYWYRDGAGGWSSSASQSQIDNINYDDNSGTPAALTANRYGVHWVYMVHDNSLHVVYGQGDYVLATAETASPPSILPGLLDAYATLIAKVIVQKSATNLYAIQAPESVTFSAADVSDHGSLSGLADDDHTQYLLASGTRALTGDIDMGGFAITNVGNVDGVDVSSHQARHNSGGDDELDHDNLAGIDALGSGVTYGHISDQAETIYGEKTFNTFPITPSAAPDADYEVANKKYVDDNAGASPLTTKGDIFVYGAADTRLPVGTNGQLLTANSAETTGLKWVNSYDHWVVGETPSGTVGGTNKAFDTANAYIAGKIEVYLNGVRQKGGGNDYTETDSNTITFVTAPQTGDVLLVNYLKGGIGTGDADTLDGQHAPSGTLVGTTDTQTLTNKTLTLPVLTGGIINFNAPEGFLLNGKIVPSVTSNNLTVALKGLDGNDPSATNPVYVRIGDTVHTITSALSVTRNAGTNWFNAGSTEHATREIDYFVYLGYNATDGVVIGFARICHARTYNGFSTTTTVDNYCAISTITNASITDAYVNIGRFSAIMSAGAGYTWTVPTFTPLNLVQRPIFQSRVMAYQPVFSADGSMTYTSVTTDKAEYRIIGNLVIHHLYFYGTTAGTASTSFRASLPFASGLDEGSYSSGLVRDGGASSNNTYGVVFTSLAGFIGVYKADNTNWGLGTLRLAQAYGVTAVLT